MNPHINELFSLRGKVALITGGGGWLGEAMTEALAQAGAAVVIAEINSEAAERVVTSMSEQQLDVSSVIADVTDEDSVRDLIGHVVQENGRLDVLVNCHWKGPNAQLGEGSLEGYVRDFRNSAGSYAVAAGAAAVHMQQIGGGSIINMSSIYGVVSDYPRTSEGLGEPDPVGYQGGKAAIIQMSRNMAVHWAKHNIRVNCISPGPFPRPASQPVTAYAGRYEREVPLGRTARPFELKGAVVFLASDASSYITGHNLMVDGGWTIW